MAGLAQAGAAAGTAIMPGVGTAIGGVLGALGDTFMGSSAGGGSQASPSNAESAVYGSGLDSSGWVVNFSGIQNATSGQDKSQPLPGGLGVSGVSGSVPGWAWIGLGGLLLWKLLKSRR